jgi:hypothetical protein
MHRNGTICDSAPSPIPIRMGVPSLGGPITTAGGVAFLTSTTDFFIRAYDVTNGAQLWEDRLPAGAQSTPMTYAVDGRQAAICRHGCRRTWLVRHEGRRLRDRLFAAEVARGCSPVPMGRFVRQIDCELARAYGAQELHEPLTDHIGGFVVYPVAHVVEFEPTHEAGKAAAHLLHG